MKMQCIRLVSSGLNSLFPLVDYQVTDTLFVILVFGHLTIIPNLQLDHISGISYELKIKGNEDVIKSFIIQTLLGGCDRPNFYKSEYFREPITNDDFLSLRYVYYSRYETIMFETVFN